MMILSNLEIFKMEKKFSKVVNPRPLSYLRLVKKCHSQRIKSSKDLNQ